MFKEDGYFVVNSLEESKLIDKLLKLNKFNLSSQGKKYNRDKRLTFCKIYHDLMTYQYLYNTPSGIKFKIEDYIKTSVESKIKEIFDNPDNVIVCNNINEKKKLFTLLHKLNYVTHSKRNYIDIKNNDMFYNIDRHCRPGAGLHTTTEFAKSKKYNIIYFSDIKNLIK